MLRETCKQKHKQEQVKSTKELIKRNLKMVLHVNPGELLRDTIEGFDIDTDLDTIDRISGNLRALQNERDLKLLTEQQELSQLSQQLANQSQILRDQEGSKQRNEVKHKIKDNQNLELNLNKKLKELTSTKQDLSSQLSNLIDEFNDLDKQISSLDTIEEDDDKDAVVLKLAVYRKFGLRIDLKSSVLIIYNKEKNLTDFLNYGDEKYSDYFISNYIWDRF